MASDTPNSSILSRLYYSTSLSGTKTQVSWVQEIPEFDPAPEGIECSAVYTDWVGQVPGRSSADALAIPILFTKDQHDILKALDKSTDYYWFILLPEETNPDGDPSCFYFQGKARLGMNAIAIDEMLQETLTIYKSTTVTEVDGLPSA